MTGQEFLGDPDTGRVGLALREIDKELDRGIPKRREDGCDYGSIWTLADGIENDSKSAIVRGKARMIKEIVGNFEEEVSKNGLTDGKDRACVASLRRVVRAMRREL